MNEFGQLDETHRSPWPVIDAISKDFSMSVSDVAQVTNGYDSTVFRAVYGGADIYIRTNSKPGAFAVEAKGYEAISSVSVPTPRILAYQESPHEIGKPTMIMSAAHGVELSRAQLLPHEKLNIYEEMGDTLRRIHSIQIEGFGELEVIDSQLEGKSKSWSEYWDSDNNLDRKELHYLAESGAATQEEMIAVEAIHREISLLKIEKGSLLHLDLNPNHVFVQNNKISSIIDLGRLISGDPRYDIAMCLAFQNSEEQERFKKGYGELSTDPVVDKYLLTILAGKVEWSYKMGLTDRFEKAVVAFRGAINELQI